MASGFGAARQVRRAACGSLVCAANCAPNVPCRSHMRRSGAAEKGAAAHRSSALACQSVGRANCANFSALVRDRETDGTCACARRACAFGWIGSAEWRVGGSPLASSTPPARRVALARARALALRAGRRCRRRGAARRGADDRAGRRPRPRHSRAIDRRQLPAASSATRAASARRSPAAASRMPSTTSARCSAIRPAASRRGTFYDRRLEVAARPSTWRRRSAGTG